MHKPQEQVRDFHRACGLRRPTSFDLPDPKDMKLRLGLILEEFQELTQAVGFKLIQRQDGEFDLQYEGRDVGVLPMIDALCDILYVVYGMAIALGLDLEPFFDEVQRANMEKAGGPKREDGKQLKPEGWRGPDHESVFLNQNKYMIKYACYGQ